MLITMRGKLLVQGCRVHGRTWEPPMLARNFLQGKIDVCGVDGSGVNAAKIKQRNPVRV